MNNNTSNNTILRTLITIYIGLLIGIAMTAHMLSKQIQDINKTEIIDTKTIEIKSDTSYVYYNKHIYTIRIKGDSVSIINIR